MDKIELRITGIDIYRSDIPLVTPFRIAVMETTDDPECDLDVVANRSRRSEIDAALSSSFAFGGLNVVLAFRRWQGV